MTIWEHGPYKLKSFEAPLTVNFDKFFPGHREVWKRSVAGKRARTNRHRNMPGLRRRSRWCNRRNAALGLCRDLASSSAVAAVLQRRKVYHFVSPFRPEKMAVTRAEGPSNSPFDVFAATFESAVWKAAGGPHRAVPGAMAGGPGSSRGDQIGRAH